MSIEKNKIIIIAGPTASGKSAMAINLAKEIGGEIINSDSRSIYKNMDIGTGKPLNEEMDLVPHHLFDLKNPNENFSVAEFKKLAEEKIEDIQNRGKTPIIVGGTGLYIDALVYDYHFSKIDKKLEIRNKLEKKSLEELQKEIEAIDPEMVNQSEIKNKRRLIRALEIFYKTGKVKSDKKQPLPKNVYYFAIETDREELYQKINQRVTKMFKEGLVEETKEILNKFSKSSIGLKTMGYKESVQYLNKEATLEEAIAKTQQAHRNLAKRQLTWFKRNKDIIWIKNLEDLKRHL